MKKIVITGANSYIGISVENWLKKSTNKYDIVTLDMIDGSWRQYDFSNVDVVFHVAGIAHADVGSVTENQKKLYYDINTNLTIEVAKRAKSQGVKQFIFMSSMIVYSGCKESIITSKTIPIPLNFYGDSKLQADIKLQNLNDDLFNVVVVRPPMIYGKGSKGNYPLLSKLSKKIIVFPKVKNKRSMLHIENLCEFIKLMIDNEESGVFFPQNKEYTNTSEMVNMIANITGHKVYMIYGFNVLIKVLKKFPGRLGNIISKVFGDFIYDMEMSKYKQDYCINTLKESIIATEGD